MKQVTDELEKTNCLTGGLDCIIGNPLGQIRFSFNDNGEEVSYPDGKAALEDLSLASHGFCWCGGIP
jgi:hypothetical protein